ncbi:acyltransferase [Pseudomonas umsongensis]|uniref:Acyltransferase n=1 Tax=Pseudomonas umsongensis TaxID=198618 RepID=A0AAE7DDM8_9PSED|nr:acyltransferase [Pseudomonas umsongensis]QJC78446.1 acyltransferase [Pseudomonas umsongensis]
MPITVIDSGLNNKISIDSDSNAKSNARISVSGNDNVVMIDSGCVFKEASIRVGNNCSITISKNCSMNKVDIYCVDSAQIKIGEGVSCTFQSKIYAHEPASITIGEKCLIANNVLMMASDMHTIYDIETGERINQAGDIKIGNHVWLAAGVNVMKGVTIGQDSVIGAGSIVTTAIPNNCVAVGSPARVVRTGTNWRPDLI